MITTIVILVLILLSIKPVMTGVGFLIKYFAFTQQKNRLKNQINKYQVEKDVEEAKKEVEKKVASSTTKEILDHFNK